MEKKEVIETDVYLEVKMVKPRKFRAYLTRDGKTIYNNTTYDVEFIGDYHIKAEIHGEFIPDFDMKLEALEIMKWMWKEHVRNNNVDSN